jgi:hypothetical protein
VLIVVTRQVAIATSARLRIECHQRSGQKISRPHYAQLVIASMVRVISAKSYIGALHLSMVGLFLLDLNMVLSLKLVTPLTS